LKNKAKSGDIAVLELMFRNVSLGKWSNNCSCYLRYWRTDHEFCAEEGQNPIFDPLPRNEKLCGNL